MIIKHVVGSQRYDATVEDRRENRSPLEYIEATVSNRDPIEAKRMKILSRDGHVPAFEEIIEEGSKQNRTKLEAKELMAVEPREILEKHIKSVTEVVRKKTRKSYRDNTALVVYVDEALAFNDKKHVARLDEEAQSTLIPMVRGREFSVLALVGSKGLYLFYELSEG